MPIQDIRYKCNNCFDFDFCEGCFRTYVIDKKELKTMYSTAHKGYHTFTKLMLAANNQNQKDFYLEGGVEEVKEIESKIEPE